MTAPAAPVGWPPCACCIGRHPGRLATCSPYRRRAAGRRGRTRVDAVSVQSASTGVTPDVVTTTSDPVVTVTGTVTNVGDRPVRDVMVRLEHAAGGHVVGGLAHRPRRRPLDQYKPVAELRHGGAELQRGQECGLHALRTRALGERAVAGHRPPGCLSAAGQRQRHTRLRCTRPARQRPVPAAGARGTARPSRRRRPTGVGRRRRARHLQTGAITMLWPLADRPRLAAGVPGGTTPVRLADDDLATSLATGGRLDMLLVGRRVRHQPRQRPRRRRRPRAVPGRRPRSAGHRQCDDRRLRRIRLPRAVTAGTPTTPAPGRPPRPRGWTGCARWPAGCVWPRRRTRRPIWMLCNASATPG